MIYEIFPDEIAFIQYLESYEWGNKPVCPYCTSKQCSLVKNSLQRHCKLCNTSYSVTTQTVFHNTKVDLRKWLCFAAIHLERSYTIREIASKIGVTNNTACRMRSIIEGAPDYFKYLLKNVMQLTNGK